MLINSHYGIFIWSRFLEYSEIRCLRSEKEKKTMWGFLYIKSVDRYYLFLKLMSKNYVFSTFSSH